MSNPARSISLIYADGINRWRYLSVVTGNAIVPGEDGWRSIRGFFQVLLSSERRERVRSIDFYRRQKFRASRRTAANRVFPVNIVTRVLATRYHRNSVPARSTNRSLTGGIASLRFLPFLRAPPFSSSSLHRERKRRETTLLSQTASRKFDRC